MRGGFSIRLALQGCTNRPFYHIVVMHRRQNQHAPPIEQLGSFDPMPNKFNEKLVAFNFERLRYWIARNAEISSPVEHLLGLSGFLPLHPRTYMQAKRNQNANVVSNKDESSNTAETK